jgi:hypothetical protein
MGWLNNNNQVSVLGYEDCNPFLVFVLKTTENALLDTQNRGRILSLLTGSGPQIIQESELVIRRKPGVIWRIHSCGAALEMWQEAVTKLLETTRSIAAFNGA